MSPLLLLGTSSAFLAVLVLWFYLEERRGVRIASQLRLRLDAAVDTFHTVSDRVTTQFGSGWVLTQLHWLLYTVLEGCMASLRFLERITERMQRRNIRSAERVHRERAAGDPDSALAQIAAHKVATTLTDKQKEVKKQAHLEGRV